MLTKKTILYIALPTLMLLTSCGGTDNPNAIDITNNKEPTTNISAKFSLGISDAPVDDAEMVNIEIDYIKLTNTDESNGKKEILINEFTNELNQSVDTITINLLDFQGVNQIKIIDEAQGITLNNGVYAMELGIVNAGSFVMLNDDSNHYNIKVPSSRLRLGEFTISDQAVQTDNIPAYTIEFDLRQSLVLRGNDPAVNGYIIKPHGVRIVSLVGSISGTISP